MKRQSGWKVACEGSSLQGRASERAGKRRREGGETRQRGRYVVVGWREAGVLHSVARDEPLERRRRLVRGLSLKSAAYRKHLQKGGSSLLRM